MLKTCFRMSLMLFTVFHLNNVGAVRIAVVGDHGVEKPEARAVARLVESWEPDHIISTGDTNYGAPEDFDNIVGPLYSSYLFPYTGAHKRSPVEHNRFWPCIGNHDFVGKGQAATLDPFFNYFQAVERRPFYPLRLGREGHRLQEKGETSLIDFFFLCSDKRCPGGIDSDSEQAQWAKQEISTSRAPWKIIVCHHPPYSSVVKTPDFPKWPSEVYPKNKERTLDPDLLRSWDISSVLSGHLHLYERFDIQGTPFIINGVGGDACYTFADDAPSPESRRRYDHENGAMLLETKDLDQLSFQFWNTEGILRDEFILRK